MYLPIIHKSPIILILSKVVTSNFTMYVLTCMFQKCKSLEKGFFKSGLFGVLHNK